MIFKFTEEEQKQIIEFEQRAKAAGIGPEDFEKHIEAIKEVSKDEIAAKTGKTDIDKISEYRELREEFLNLLCKFESDHFGKLRTQTQIIENAKERTKEALVFIYNYLDIKELSGVTTKPLFGFEKIEYIGFFRVVAAIGAKELFSYAEESTKEPIFLLEYESFLKCLRRYIINDHFEKLKGKTGERKLEKEIALILEKSKYIGHKKEYKGNFAIYDEKAPVYYGKYIDNFLDVTKQEQKINLDKNQIEVIGGDNQYTFSITFPEGLSPSGRFSIATDKLLLASGAEFAKLNNYPFKKSKNANNEVKYAIQIPLVAYAKRCGYDVEEHPKESPEESEKEKKRAQEALKTARKRIKKDLEILYNSSFSWKEKMGDKEEDFLNIRLLEAAGIRKGYINIAFSRTYVNYLLKHRVMTQFSNKLLLVDGNHENAYYLGLKMVEHYNMYRNQERGTADILKVSTLLKYSTLPNIDKIKAQRASWQSRIKEPLENTLEYLVNIEILRSWKYVKPKGEDLSEEEATNIVDYSIFEQLYISFTMNDTEIA